MRRGATVLAQFAIVALSLSPAIAQDSGNGGSAIGTAEDIDPNESPVIIEERGSTTDNGDQPIRSEGIVQIQGEWASDEGACATGEANSGIYVTDTLVRWQGASCSIRNIDATETSATLYAECAMESERRNRKFRVESSGENQLTFSLDGAGEQEQIILRRCPEGQ